MTEIPPFYELLGRIKRLYCTMDTDSE